MTSLPTAGGCRAQLWVCVQLLARVGEVPEQPPPCSVMLGGLISRPPGRGHVEVDMPPAPASVSVWLGPLVSFCGQQDLAALKKA